MAVTGILTGVDVEQLGSSTIAEALAGATRLLLDDASVFADEGGKAQIEFLNATEDPVTLQVLYTTVDHDTSELVLAAALTQVVPEDADVLVFPLSGFKMAQVQTSDEDDTLDAYVSHALSTDALFDVGDREPGAGVPVVVDMVAGRWTVIDVVQRTGKVLADTVVGPNPNSPMTDGLPPETAPILTVEQFAIGAIRAKWLPVPNADPVSYRVYASLQSPVALDDLHLVDTVSATSLVIQRINGVAIPYGQPTYVVVVPFDADGDGPPSEELFGSPRQVTGPDVAANYVYAGVVQAGQVQSGTLEADLTLSGRIKTAVAGQRVELSQIGLQAFNAANQLTTSISAATGALSATGATISGTVNANAGVFSGSISVTGSIDVTSGQIRSFGSGQAAQFSSGDLSISTLQNGAFVAPSVRVRPARIDMFRTASIFSSIRQTIADNMHIDASGNLHLNVDRLYVNAAASNQESITFNGDGYVVAWPVWGYTAGTSNSRPVYVNNNTARFHTPTSSRAKKQDITALELDPAVVLQLEPVRYRNREDVREWVESPVIVSSRMVTDEQGVPVTDERGDPVMEQVETRLPEPGYEVGFIAEDLLEIGLAPYVFLDEHGKPAGIHYDRLATALVIVAKDLDARLRALEAA